jgi:kumamolisin
MASGSGSALSFTSVALSPNRVASSTLTPGGIADKNSGTLSEVATMPATQDYHVVPGSERIALPESRIIGEVDPKQLLTITVRIRRPGGNNQLPSETIGLSQREPGDRRYPTRTEFAAKHGADDADLAKVAAFAHEHGLVVADSSRAKRSVKLSGTMEALSTAFKVKMHRYTHANSSYRGRIGPISVPVDLAQIVVGVQGFDNRPVARPHYRHRKKATVTKMTAPATAQENSFSPLEVANLYSFPEGLDGKGECIALIEFNDINTSTNVVTGGGFSESDLQAFFSNLNLSTPQVFVLSTDGGANKPGPNPNSDAEVTLDVEVAGAIAPGAKFAVYFAPNTAQGFIDAVTQAVHDVENAPSVVSISWGGSEDSLPQQFLDSLESVLQDAATLGVTVCCAAGDYGSANMPTNDPNNPWDGLPHVDFPASSPFALACGGTKLVGSGNGITSEQVWNEGSQAGAGGGGVSNKFARPDYQASLNIPTSPKGNNGRGLPDVSANADPETGYQVFLSGHSGVIGGTSAVAPLWAGLIARINQGLVKMGKSRVGFLNPFIYESSIAKGGAFHDIVSGSNDNTGTLGGRYTAGPGWDPASGLGSPNGAKLLNALRG